MSNEAPRPTNNFSTERLVLDSGELPCITRAFLEVLKELDDAVEDLFNSLHAQVETTNEGVSSLED